MIMRQKIITIIMGAILVSLSCAWFYSPGYPSGKKVYITSCNGFDTLAPDSNYDYGDTNAAITARAGGFSAEDAFLVGYPVTFGVMLDWDLTGIYQTAKLQYFQGTNSGTSTNWITIGTITNSFDELEGKEGAHFGLVTWYPPVVTNVQYLVRIYATVEASGTNYISSNLSATNIDAHGDGNTWSDWSVLGIKVINVRCLSEEQY
jgi:hypothetical protein